MRRFKPKQRLQYYLISILLVILPFIDLSAQVRFSGIPYIRNYTRQEYNSSPFNWGIVQDKRGVIYVANNYHILEFDGHAWKAIPLPNRTVIRSLAIDQQGRVYVGGQADIGYLTPDERGETSYVSLKSRIKKEHQLFADVWKILVTEDGVVFCTSAGLYYLYNDEIRFFPTPADELGFTSYFYCSQRLFLCSAFRGILEFKKGEFVKIPNSETVASFHITGMLPAPGNKILLVTQRNGLFHFNGHSAIERWAIEETEYFKNNTVMCAAASQRGYVLGSAQRGMLLLSKEGRSLLHLDNNKGLQHNAVEAVMTDHNDNLWLALRDGMDYVEVNSPFTVYDRKNGIAGAGFTSLMEDDRLLLGTSEGLYVTRKQANRSDLMQNEFALIEGSEGQTYNLQDIHGHVLLTHNNGVFEVKGNSAVRVGTQTGAWLFMPLLAHPGYFVCGSYNGLYLYEIDKDKIVFHWKIQGFDESSRVMEQDDEGSIWIAHGYLGVFRVKLTRDLTMVEKVDFYNSVHGFPSDVFINVFNVNHQLVFTGQRGMYKFNRETNRFDAYEKFNPFIPASQHTRKLIEDKEGNIWFSAGDDIGVLKKRSDHHYEVAKTIFNKLQRKLVGGFEHIAYYDANNVIIGTDDGFVHVDPSFVFNQDQSFNTLIRKVETTAGRDSLLSGGWTNAIAGQSESYQSTSHLPYSLNSIRFTFAASSYEDVAKVQYQYKLEGYDKVWSAWGRLTTKEYTNLREGDYTFKVRSRDIYHREGSVALFAFEVKPPWFRTTWAYMLYIALLAIMVYALVKIVRHEQQKRMALKEVQHQEEVLRAEKEIIKLNNEKLEAELAHKNKELATSAMHIVYNEGVFEKVKDTVMIAMQEVQDEKAKHEFKKVLRAITVETTGENNWEQFEHHFNQIHQDFLVRLRQEFPTLTQTDIKLISYLKLNLSTKEIAPLLNLSVRGVEASRYRIRKKMNLSPEVNLAEFILRY